MSRRVIDAEIHLLGTNEGGRSAPLLSGYRSLLRFEEAEVDYGFELELSPDAHPSGIAPSESGMARLSFWAVEELPTLSAGLRFDIREGVRVIGHGRIVQSQ